MKKIIIGVLVIIEIFSLYMMYQSNESKNLNEVNIKDNKINKNTFAIYWDENGTGKYTEYTGDSWPGKGYTLDLNNTECMNEKGEKLNNDILSYSNNSLTLTSNYTAYCTLYFSKTISLGKFCKDETNMETCMNNKKSTIVKVENMTSSLVGGMYRYQGTDNVNNWICFGTTNKEECTSGTDNYGDGIDKYMYRIIGVTPEGELALIKETAVKEGTETKFQWNDKFATRDCEEDGSKCTWANSKLYNRLNGLCNDGNADCNGTESGKIVQSNIFIGNNYYEYLNEESTWLEKINTHTWKYGESTQLDTYNGDNAYAIESQFTDSIPDAKIGLQYLYDYYYAYPNGNPENYSNAKNAWIFYQKDEYNTNTKNEWLISKCGVSNSNFIVAAWEVNSTGNVYGSYLHNSWGVRPVFYLKPNIKINNASGSKDDPFMITN